MSTNRDPVAFNRFGGLRLDLPLDEIGAENAQYLRDVDWDGNAGRLRPRDGFQKLKAADATGPYKALFPHSAVRLLATKRVSAGSVKLVAIDKAGVEQKETTWPETAATACFAHFGIPSASFTYCRANLAAAEVVRFDGTEFKEPTCSVDGVAGKEMPRGKFMVAWPDAENRLVVANTGLTGGPGGAASSNSHVWFSKPGNAEGYESTAFDQLDPGDGEEITGLAVFGAQVFVFKETRFFVYYGNSIDEEGRPDFKRREVSLGEGVRMKRPAVEALTESSDQLACVAADGVYFCTSGGVYLTTGGPPAKISQALRPLEEVSPFDGPMAEFLNGSTESFRWPATGILSLGQRLIVRRFEFMFVLDIPTGEWTCWKMSAVSMCVWIGLTGGGAESTGEKAASSSASSGTVAWTNPGNAKAKDGAFATTQLEVPTVSSGKLSLTNFGAPVPVGATISGIQLTLWAKVTKFGAGGGAPLVTPTLVALLREGAESTNLAGTGTVPPGTGIAISETPVSYTFGGPESLWGLSWTPAQFNAASSGLVLACSNAGSSGCIVEVDAIFLTAFYLTAEAVSGVRPRLFCTQSKSVFYTAPTAEEQAGTRLAEWQAGFYDLGSQDEKTIVEDKAFGRGAVLLSGFSDFRTAPDAGFPSTLAMPSSGIGQARSEKSHPSATLFSHRLKLEPGSQIQRLIRYVREGRTATTKSQ